MSIKILFILLFVCISSLGCKKYLDAKPDDKLVVPDDLTSLQSLLDNGQYMNAASPSIGEASADDYYLNESNYNSLVTTVQQAYIWDLAGRNDYNFGYGGDWANLYFIVYNANLCLDELSGIQKTSQNSSAWDNLKGSALFFRGRSFLQLSWLYAKGYNKQTAATDLGVVLRKASDYNVPSKRASVEECYDQIISDLKTAVSLLPTAVEVALRPSKASAYGYLARTYLSMGEYDSAYTYANKCLQINNQLMDYNDPDLVDLSNPYPFKDLNKEVIHENYDNNFVIYSIMNKHGLVDSSLYNSYDENDIRKSAYFMNQDGAVSFYGSYKGGTAFFTGIATDEIYLIRAECEARLEMVPDAMADLNSLLVTRWKSGTYVPYSAGTKQKALAIILKERRKELVLRDLRWCDIKRLNLAGESISIKRIIDGQEYELPPNDNRFALPLPTDIIDLTGMAQNPQ